MVSTLTRRKNKIFPPRTYQFRNPDGAVRKSPYFSSPEGAMLALAA